MCNNAFDFLSGPIFVDVSYEVLSKSFNIDSNVQRHFCRLNRIENKLKPAFENIELLTFINFPIVMT